MLDASIKKSHRAETAALRNAIHRCDRPNNVSYKSYGGRGIKVADELYGQQGVLNLIAAIGPRPSSDYSLDRIDNDAGYTLSPLNLRWTDRKTQQCNTRKRTSEIADYGWGIGCAKLEEPGKGLGKGCHKSALLPYKGHIQTVADWSRELGLKPSTIRQRLERGLSPADALDTNTSRRKPRADK